MLIGNVTLSLELLKGRYPVNRYRRYLPLIALVFVGITALLENLGVDLDGLTNGNTTTQQNQSNNSGSNAKRSHPSTKQWSSTSPEINLWHVFEGEINRKGKPTGYHSRPGGIDAANARIVSIKDRPNRAGVYTANIEVRDGNQWKQKFSSFFPDNMSQNEVIDVIVNAYNNSKNKNKQPWQGPSGLGFNVQGYTTSRGGINTAFPVFVRNQ